MYGQTKGRDEENARRERGERAYLMRRNTRARCARRQKYKTINNNIMLNDRANVAAGQPGEREGIM